MAFDPSIPEQARELLIGNLCAIQEEKDARQKEKDARQKAEVKFLEEKHAYEVKFLEEKHARLEAEKKLEIQSLENEQEKLLRETAMMGCRGLLGKGIPHPIAFCFLSYKFNIHNRVC